MMYQNLRGKGSQEQWFDHDHKCTYPTVWGRYKSAYRSELAAEMVAHYWMSKHPYDPARYVYQCYECLGWHLTKRRQ